MVEYLVGKVIKNAKLRSWKETLGNIAAFMIKKARNNIKSYQLSPIVARQKCIYKMTIAYSYNHVQNILRVKQS